MRPRLFDRCLWRPTVLAAVCAFGLLGSMDARAAPRLDPRQAALIADTLRTAVDEGFAADAFPADPAAAAAAIAYASAQHGGRLAGADFLRDWAIRPAPYNASAEFAKAVAENRLAAWLAGQAPADPRYVRLVRGYARYRAIAAAGGWPVLPKTPGLAAGASGPAVEALRARLAIEDRAIVVAPRAAGPAPATAPGTVFDEAMTAAVARAQDRYGLESDGRLGPATLAALNVPVQTRLMQIRANLERWRWVPRALPPYRIEVNSAGAMLELFAGQAPSMAMRVIVGRAGKDTPMLEDKVSGVVFNPPWNVPADIAASEIWPKIRRDPGYQAREDFVVRPGGGLQQLPGPKCALGAIKFELSNNFGVYMHDTPARSLFARDRRALSHGCMRLADPTDLAKRLLAGDPAWPETAINLALLSGKTSRAPLKVPVPVYVFYWTAFADDQDQVQFRTDVYGWDNTLQALMSHAGHSL
jgi:murein L,D-transpeptidase YcbB/YkuD